MAGLELGDLEYVEVRKIWPHEERDFTPWLAKRLALLGDSLGIELELVSVETRIADDRRLDILAVSRYSGSLVAIENQFGYADYDHFNRLSDYADELTAPVRVLVAEHFDDRILADITRLNRQKYTEIAVYGVEISVLRIEDSPPAPQLRVVSFPRYCRHHSNFELDITLQWQQYRDFFQPVIDRLHKMGLAGQKPLPYRVLYFPSEFSEISFEAETDRFGSYFSLYVGISGHQAAEIYAKLSEYKYEIEAEMGNKLWWNPSKRFPGFFLVGLGGRTLENVQTNLSIFIPQLKAIINPRLERILGIV